MSIIASVSLILLFVFSKINVEKEAVQLEGKIEKEFLKFDRAYNQIQNRSHVFKAVQGVDFLIYDNQAKIISWTNNAFIPSFEEFLISPEFIFTSGSGEFIYKIYNSSIGRNSFKVVALVLVRSTFSNSRRALPDYYNRNLIPLNIEISYGNDSTPVKYKGQELFNVKWTRKANFDANTNVLSLIILLFLFVGVFIIIYQWAILTKVKQGYFIGAIQLIVSILVLRGLMIGMDFPSGFFKIGIFSVSTFRFEWFFSTLGDAILNVMALNLILVYLIKQKVTTPFWKKSFIRSMAQMIFVLLGYFSLYLFSDAIEIILAHSQISLDIAESLVFNVERIFAYGVIVSLVIMYFLVSYLGFEVFKSGSAPWKKIISFQVTGFMLTGVLLWSYDHIALVLIGNVVYNLFLFYYQLPVNLGKVRFDSLQYLLFSAIVLSVCGAILIFKSFEEKELNKVQKFATYLKFDRDFEGEYLLSNITNQIKNDVIINAKMINPQSQHESIVKCVKRNFLNNQFNNYEVEISFFNPDGTAVATDGVSIQEWKSIYDKPLFFTGFNNVYADGRMDLGKRKEFICFVQLERYKNITGYLKIDLLLKKFSSKRVLPQLLLEKKSHSETDYDFGFFSRDMLVYKSGEFDYESGFDVKLLALPELYLKGVRNEGFRYYGFKSRSKVLVVTSELYPVSNIVSNFSFLFAVFLLLGSIIVAFNFAFIAKERMPLSFSTKILLYSGASFVIPLLLISTALMTSIDNSNRKEIDKSKLKKTRVMTENLSGKLLDLEEGLVNKEGLENFVSDLALHSGMDLNLYSEEGKMLASSTPAIFESNIISKFLDSRAMNLLVGRRKESLVLEESIGSFQYKTSYVSIYSPKSGDFLGVLGSPYFASKSHLKRQQLEVFGSVINIFTFVFIVSILIASFIISKITGPIVAIADRLHETGFVETNTPIEWSTDDEIGILVHEYNSMLEKLERSKVELARNEKEAAWREMAKQVAHEIKNPLTPMKLTIQHLQRILEPRLDEKKSLGILLNQIDTLDEIVTSFSHFAKMPTPLNEPFDILYVIEKSIDLHVNKKIEKKLHDGVVLVNGDEKLFGRIFSNLILNAFQAMKSVENPLLKISAKKEGDNILIEFMDIGGGIPDNIQEKVFTPNFSTKETGSGIGLAVAKRGIEHANGSVWLETRMNEGTSFFVKMPIYHLGS